jgi:hypothetical protein
MRAARSPDRTQTIVGAISHRRPDRTYSTPSWFEPDRRPSARPIRRSGRGGRPPTVSQNARDHAASEVPKRRPGAQSSGIPGTMQRVPDGLHRLQAGPRVVRSSPMRERQRSAGSAAIASYFPVALERVATALVIFVLGCVTAGIGVFSSDPHALRLQVPRPVYWVVGAAACWFAAFASRGGGSPQAGVTPSRATSRKRRKSSSRPEFPFRTGPRSGGVSPPQRGPVRCGASGGGGAGGEDAFDLTDRFEHAFLLAHLEQLLHGLE